MPRAIENCFAEIAATTAVLRLFGRSGSLVTTIGSWRHTPRQTRNPWKWWQQPASSRSEGLEIKIPKILES
jgi:hypothetical protein